MGYVLWDLVIAYVMIYIMGYMMGYMTGYFFSCHRYGL